jgi:outer membrane protein OmpA-like peptidoglycan-associated protein
MLLSLLLAPAWAQETVAFDASIPDMNAQLFRPSIDAAHFAWTDESSGGADGSFTNRVVMNWVADPLVYTYEDGTRVEVVSDVFQLDLIGAYNLGRFRAGLDVPLILRALGDTTTGETGLGSLAVDLRSTLLERDAAPVGLAVAGRLGLPTATVDSPVVSERVTAELQLIADRQIGDFVLAANVGHRTAPQAVLENLSWDDQVLARLGGAYSITDAVGASVDFATQAVYGELDNPYARPAEVHFGGWLRPGGRPVLLRGGAGSGLGPGVGAPQARVTFAVEYLPEGAQDADLDGLVDAEDGCPAAPEDVDGWRDDDGCPEPTSVTVRFEDPDGAAIAAVDYRLDEQPGRASAGALELALEPGGYRVAALADGFQEGALSIDVPPGAPAEFVLVLEPTPPPPEPEPEPPAPDVTEALIDLADEVRFETSSAQLTAASRELLDGVVTILLEHPELTLLRIEGHTDERGDDGFNLKLSQDRAASVRQHLVDGGIAPERLVAEGYGETRPVDPRSTPEAWEKNRRVVFFVEERAP